MKTLLRLPIAAFVASLLFIGASAQAQNTPAPRYKDVLAENPNAEADVKVVSDYTNAIVSGDQVKAKSLLSDKFMGYGPSSADSADVEKTMTTWTANYKTQADRKVNFVAQTFRVLSGSLKGSWVSVWGDYTFTEAGKTVKFPFQSTSRVVDGKIVTSRIYYDRMFILQQLGHKVTPPETAKK